MSISEEALQFLLDRRGIDTPCSKCTGYGVVSYASTSTWRGGMGGSMITQDVCDTCWGSGDQDRHWADLRRMRAEENERIAAAAANLLAERCGVGSGSLLDALEALCDELDRFSRQRRPRPSGFDTVTKCLSGVLREMVTAKRQKVASE